MDLKLYVLDEETEFVEHFLYFMSTNSYTHKFDVKCFTKLDLLVQQIQQESDHLLLVISDKFESSWQASGSHIAVVWLTEQNQELTLEEMNISHGIRIYRFQAFEKIFSTLLTYSQSMLVNKKILSTSKTEIISFFSSVGHCGKTFMALSLAKQLSLRGKKVFFVNLEENSALSELMAWQDNQNFSNLIYYNRTNSDMFNMKFDQFTQRDSQFGIHYLSPSVNEDDLHQLTSADLKRFFQFLIELESYDYVFVDLTCSLHSWVLDCLAMSHHIYWLVLDNLSCLRKTQNLLKRKVASSNAHFILNKFTGRLINDYGSIGIHLKGYLPYVPEWKTFAEPRDFLHHTHFDSQVIDVFLKVKTC